MSCTGNAPGTCTFNPASLVPTAGGAAFTVTVGSATAGIFNFSIQGTDGTLTHSQAVSLTVGTDVTWTDTGNNAVTVEAGDSAIYSFSAAPAGGATFSGTVNFACANLPELTSCSFNPPSIGAGAGTTAVTLTIATTGPYGGNSMRDLPGANPKHRGLAKANGRSIAILWLTIPLAGVLLAGITLRRTECLLAGCCVALVWLLLLSSCGGLGGGSGGGGPPPVTVTVTPRSAELYENEPGNNWPAADTEQQFSAVVNNGSSQTVTWAVTGGNANGTIDSNGLYIAPPVAPNPAEVTIMATSSLAASPGSATVNLMSATNLGTSNIQVTATAAGGAGHGVVVSLTVD